MSKVSILFSFFLFSFFLPELRAADGLKPSASDKILVLKIKGADSVTVMKSFPKVKGVEEKAFSGDELVVGDEIRVPANLVVQLRQWDGSNFFIGPHSNFKLEARIPDKQSFSSWTFALARGAVRGQVESDPAKQSLKVRIKTPTAAMGVRGTEFLVTYTPENPMRVYTRKGEVLLGRSEKFEEGSFISIKEKMMGEILSQQTQKIEPAKENASAFDEAMKNAGIPEDLNDVEEGKKAQSMADCLLRGLGWRAVQGLGPFGECF